jgi:Arc/MetJ-type ribon-helix-helix transcriptional regulator
MLTMELEKVCVNITPAELGQIDILVARGLYTTRTDVIRTGIRLVLEQNASTVTHVVQGSTGFGYMTVSRDDLETSLSRGERQRMFVVGVLRLDSSISPDLADATIERINILGSLKAPKEVVERLGSRVTHEMPGVS